MVVQIIKVPGINGLGKTEGCEKSGDAILSLLREEIYTNELGKKIEMGNLDIEEIHLDNANLEITNELIYKNSFEAYELKDKLIFLGGDHSISYSLTRAFFDYCETNSREPCLIVFDAHPDCIDSSGGKYPTHEEWLHKLVSDGFPAKNILLVGVRNSHFSELNFLKEKGIKVISILELVGDLEGKCDAIMEFSNGKELYVSLDIDVVDPAYAPGVGYPEPGGISSRDLIYIFQRINKVKSLKSLDIVEINKKKDSSFDNQTIKLGAKILSELL